MPVKSSINGYRQEIGFLQLAHFPLSHKKEIKGILYFQGINFLHFGQIDLPDRGELP